MSSIIQQIVLALTLLLIVQNDTLCFSFLKQLNYLFLFTFTLVLKHISNNLLLDFNFFLELHYFIRSFNNIHIAICPLNNLLSLCNSSFIIIWQTTRKCLFHIFQKATSIIIISGHFFRYEAISLPSRIATKYNFQN